ncbi:MAG: glucose-6-phosphate dehydrogenase [Deltaproteobacteria bacterium]|nr:glucose-6-phosphate dehydrogenase [Deltaproteobacteria bacterium]
MNPLNPLRAGLDDERLAPPCAIVIFGASGDLTRRKLVPALYHLQISRMLAPGSAIVGFARKSATDAEFREEQREATMQHARSKPVDPESWSTFESSLFYVQGAFDDASGFERLKSQLERIDATHGTRGNRLFYLATPPEFFGPISRMLASAGLIGDPTDSASFTRVIVEKPFGHDLESSRVLDRALHEVLHESQIYRIDHYLGKEAVQNLLAFRFGNAIFEPLWRRENIDHVQITVAEEIGIEGRGKFYEGAGATRDIIQNHLFQLLMLVAMEPPSAFDADSVRDEKVKVLRALRPMARERISELTARGQYGRGTLGGAPLTAYREEPDVNPDSRTETFAAMRIDIDNWRWQGVPFYIRTGKRLTRRVSEVAVRFKAIPVALFGRSQAETAPNELVLRIQPDEGITLRVAAKQPGSRMLLRDVNMDFRYGTTWGRTSADAYERLILDALLGDATLFARNDEVDESWRYITPILEYWQEMPAPGFPNYSSGTWGPAAAEALVERDGRRWRRP